MPLNIPLKYDSIKHKKSFSKLLATLKYPGYLLWGILIIYFFYNYIKTKELFPLVFSMFLLGWLLKKAYIKIKK